MQKQVYYKKQKIMKLSINIKHIEAVRLYYREESKEFWLEISTTSNKPIIVPYKDKEEADKKYQYILRRIPHIIIED